MEDSGADGPSSSDHPAGPEQSQLGLKPLPAQTPSPAQVTPRPRPGGRGEAAALSARGLVQRTGAGKESCRAWGAQEALPSGGRCGTGGRRCLPGSLPRVLAVGAGSCETPGAMPALTLAPAGGHRHRLERAALLQCGSLGRRQRHRSRLQGRFPGAEGGRAGRGGGACRRRGEGQTQNHRRYFSWISPRGFGRDVESSGTKVRFEH